MEMGSLSEITPSLVQQVCTSHPNLDTLNLSNNSIARIQNLAPLVSLTALDISGNQITHADGLEDLPRLVELDLSRNRLASAQGVEPCTELRCLNLSDNQITEIEALRPLQSLPALHTLTLEGNPVVFSNPTLPQSLREMLPRLLYLDGNLLPLPRATAASDSASAVPDPAASLGLGSGGSMPPCLSAAPAVALAGLATCQPPADEPDEAAVERERAWKLAWKLEDASTKSEALEVALAAEREKSRGLASRLEEETAALLQEKAKDAGQKLYRTLPVVLPVNEAEGRQVEAMEAQMRRLLQERGLSEERHKAMQDVVDQCEVALAHQRVGGDGEGMLLRRWRESSFSCLFREKVASMEHAKAINALQERATAAEGGETRAKGLEQAMRAEAELQRSGRQAAEREVESLRRRCALAEHAGSSLLPLASLMSDSMAKFETAGPKVDALSRRLQFACGRLQVVEALTRRQKNVEKATGGAEPGSQQQQQETAGGSISLRKEVARLREELAAASEERKILLEKVAEDPTGHRTALSELQHRVDQAEAKRTSETGALHLLVQESHQQRGAFETRLLEAQRHVRSLHADLETASLALGVSRKDAADAEEAYTERLRIAEQRLHAAHESESMDAAAELAATKRELNKAVLTLGQLERDSARGKALHEAEVDSHAERLEEQLEERTGQLREARKERDLLIVSVRQLERAAVSGTESREGKAGDAVRRRYGGTGGLRDSTAAAESPGEGEVTVVRTPWSQQGGRGLSYPDQTPPSMGGRTTATPRTTPAPDPAAASQGPSGEAAGQPRSVRGSMTPAWAVNAGSVEEILRERGDPNARLSPGAALGRGGSKLDELAMLSESLLAEPGLGRRWG